MSQKDGGGTLIGGRLDKLVVEGKLKLSDWDPDFFSRGMFRLTLLLRIRHLGHKLFEMVGTAWILDLLNISDHFAF